MSVPDWTQPPLYDGPGDLGPALLDSQLIAIESDRPGRQATLRFALPPDAGTPEATFVVEAATHLLGTVYLPPAIPLSEGLAPEEAMAAVGDWARQGMIVSGDPLSFGTPCVVQRAFLHVGEESATLVVEGYGDDPDALVWWEVRVSGRSISAADEIAPLSQEA